jgi:hypothetical protein
MSLLFCQKFFAKRNNDKQVPTLLFAEVPRSPLLARVCLFLPAPCTHNKAAKHKESRKIMVLEGCIVFATVIHSSGLDGSAVVASKLVALGANVVKVFTREVTHVVFEGCDEELRTITEEAAALFPASPAIVTDAWVLACEREQRRAVERPFACPKPPHRASRAACSSEDVWYPHLARRLPSWRLDLLQRHGMLDLDKNACSELGLRMAGALLQASSTDSGNTNRRRLQYTLSNYRLLIQVTDTSRGVTCFQSIGVLSDVARIDPPPLVQGGQMFRNLAVSLSDHVYSHANMRERIFSQFKLDAVLVRSDGAVHILAHAETPCSFGSEVDFSVVGSLLPWMGMHEYNTPPEEVEEEIEGAAEMFMTVNLELPSRDGSWWEQGNLVLCGSPEDADQYLYFNTVDDLRKALEALQWTK